MAGVPPGEKPRASPRDPAESPIAYDRAVSIDTLIDRLVARAEADERIRALLLYGSHAAGTADEHSDVDIGVVVAKEGFEELIGARDEIVGAAGSALLVFDFGDPTNVHVILEDGTALELIFARESELAFEGPYRALLDKDGVAERAASRHPEASEPLAAEEVERRIHGFWHDVEHLATALGRGETWWAYGQLDELRRMVIGLARLEADLPPEDEAYWKADRTLPADLLARLSHTVAPLEPGPIRDGALELLEVYREIASALAAWHGVSYPEELDHLLTDRLRRVQTA